MKTKDFLWLLAGFTLGWLVKGFWDERKNLKRDWNRHAKIYWKPTEKGQIIPRVNILHGANPPKGSKRIFHENHPGGQKDTEEDTFALRLIEEGKTLDEAWLVVLKTKYKEAARQDPILIATERRNFMRRIRRKMTRTSPP